MSRVSPIAGLASIPGVAAFCICRRRAEGVQTRESEAPPWVSARKDPRPDPVGHSFAGKDPRPSFGRPPSGCKDPGINRESPHFACKDPRFRLKSGVFALFSDTLKLRKGFRMSEICHPLCEKAVSSEQ